MHDRKVDAPAQRPAPTFARVGVVLGLTLITYLVCVLVPEPKAGGEVGVVMTLPDEIGDLFGHDQAISAAELYILPKDTTFARKSYARAGVPNGPDRIECSIILSGAERRSIHRPERCLPGQGWRIDGTHTESVLLASGRNLEVTALLLEKPANRPDGTTFTVHQYFLYWFVGKNITTPSQTRRILMTYWDMLIHRVNQRWAYVIVSKFISRDWDPNGESRDETLADLKQFIHDSVPFYMKSEMPAGNTAEK